MSRFPIPARDPWRWRASVVKYKVRSRVVGWFLRTFRPHVHCVEDRRGYRTVYVDGVRVDRAFYADTRAGFVRVHCDPIRLTRHQTVRWRKIRGQVRVVRGP